MSIFEDHVHRLWIGTTSGLFMRDQESDNFTVYTVENGLPSDWICAVLEDDRGDIWISSMNGLSRLNTVTKIFTNYDMYDGLQSNEFFYGAFKDKNGELYFGGINGFNVFHPDSIQENTFVPPVVITDFKISNVSRPLVDYVIDRDRVFLPNRIDAIELSYKDNVFSFEFAALDYTIPEKNMYAYRMDGFDVDWFYVDASRRSATYTNLPGGHYTFHVKASNDDGLWNEEGVSIDIRIIPPIWKTRWALLLYILVVLGILFGLLKIIVIRQRYEADRRLDEQKLQFFTNVSHEFRTPLTLIIGPLEKLVQSGKKLSWEKRANAYRMILRNVRRLLRLINQLLDMRKLGTTGLQLELSRQDIVHLLKVISETFRFQAVKRKINFQFKADQETIIAFVDTEKLDKIVFNLLSNAFNATLEGGRITLSVSCLQGRETVIQKYPLFGRKNGFNLSLLHHLNHDDLLEISVQDTGIGIPLKNIADIFNPFYQVPDQETMSRCGSGIGLALTKELVGLHHGTILVHSEPGDGTQFTVLLPMDSECDMAASAVSAEDNKAQIIYKDVSPADSVVIRPGEADQALTAPTSTKNCRCLLDIIYAAMPIVLNNFFISNWIV